MEHGLLNLVVPLRLRGLTRLSPGDIEQAFVANERKTLGQLIHDARNQVEIPDEISEKLTEALAKRNHLMHGFFAAHSVDFNSTPGRRDMIEELRSTTLDLQAADRALEPITRSLWQRLGMSDEIFERALDEMLAEAASRESSS